MKLTKKLLWPITAFFLVALAVFLVLYRSALLNAFTSIEIKRAQASEERVMNLISSEADDLQAKAMDYSRWDSTYDFIKAPYQGYIDSAFADYSSFQKLDINEILISDLEGSVVFHKELDCSTSQAMGSDAAASLSGQLLRLMNEGSKASIKGIVKTDKGPMMVACERVFNGGAGSESDGFLILGKYIDQNEIYKISRLVGVNFTLEPFQAGMYSENAVRQGELALVNSSASDSLTSLMPLSDITGANAYTIRITQVKDLVNEANASIDLCLGFVCIGFLLFLILMLKYMDGLVLRRLAYIRDTVENIRNTSDMALRIAHDGIDDEISDLGMNFNSMFESLQHSSRKLEDSQKKYSLLFSNMLSSFMYCKAITDGSGKMVDFAILESNSALERMIRLPRERYTGKPALDFMPEELGKGSRFMKMAEAVVTNNFSPISDSIYLSNLDTWLNLSIHSTEQDHFAVSMSDITEMKKYEQQIFDLAYFDELTNLPNRKNLLRRIQSIIDSRKSSFALLFVDLDNFKNINDSLGHDVGDYVLTQAALRLKELTDESVYLGRLGGDEFVVVINDLKYKAHAEAFALRMLEAIRPAIKYKENDLYVGASIGISCYPDDGEDLSTLMRNADTAMYEAKRKGGYCFVSYSKQMNDSALEMLLLENKLKSALANEELKIFYQPVAELSTMSVVGYEALSRWELDGRLLPPGEFIPIAKSIGEIPKIDNWVLRNACLQCRRWQEADGKKLTISVNISFKQLKEPGFFLSVMDALEYSGLDPGCLKLEITEHEAMEDVDLTLEVLSKLKARGVTICLDDFGTGYSSLSYMNRLPIDTLKIDMKLISTIDRNFKTLEIVRSIVAMAQTLGIKVTAEGVERESQLDLLKWMGCTSVQGYLISHPKPPEEFYRQQK
jgi:diguanylate cyclase (GGDEF)-like protein